MAELQNLTFRANPFAVTVESQYQIPWSPIITLACQKRQNWRFTKRTSTSKDLPEQSCGSWTLGTFHAAKPGRRDKSKTSHLTPTLPRVLPILALLFLCSFLDRTNVGNAKILGLEDDLNITNHQYTHGLAIFYAFYIASEVPSNLVLKHLTPRIWLPLLTFLWGVVGMSLGFVRNYGDFLAVRALLGLTEGGLLPGMVLYLSSMYTRSELALRIGLFYTTASLSGAFGGLLARGLSAIPTTPTVDAGWRWIMIIEGLLTSVVGALAYFALPNSVATAGFLSAEERDLAQARLHKSHSTTLPHSAGPPEPERFKWSEVLRGISSPQLWLSGTAYFAILSGLYSFGLFLPSIVVQLGYTANTAQLMTVPPYAVAAVITVVVAYLSDRLRVRGVVMLFTIPIAIVGYAAIANVGESQNAVKYGMVFLMATGLYASVPPILVWISNNSAGHYKRATTTGAQLAIANCGGFVSTFIYTDDQKPVYFESHTIVMSLLCYAWAA